MGEVIGANADVGRIADHVRRTLWTARMRAGEIGAAAETRLAAAVAAMDAAARSRKAAVDAAVDAWQAVLAEDAKSDAGINRVRDAMWNALGRTRPSPALAEVFPGGVTACTSGNPRQQPALMQQVRSRLLLASAPQWSQEMRERWAAELEALRAPYQAAVDAHRPAEAAATDAQVRYRAAVRTAHSRLRDFKRDLRTLGLSHAQIHAIIPDAANNDRGS